MKVKDIVTQIVIIELTKDEASWLHGFIQNYPGDPADELLEHLNIRITLFEALKDIL